EPTVSVFHAFTEPTVVAPLDGASVTISGTTVDLKWESTNPDGAAPLASVYLGSTDTPPLYKAGVAALTLNVPVVKGQTYYWYVVMTDANGVMTTSPTWSFTIFEPIGIFVGAFTAEEPAEDYNYPVVFKKTSDTTLSIDAYWNSWPAVFTLNFTANTFSMALTNFGGGYEGIESGTINPANGQMVGTYTIWQTKAGVRTAIETGVHTYNKK
ncbi:MAG TPA: hypothetical protein VGK10_21490, partial [Prolixibacteraceae bacterium]